MMADSGERHTSQPGCDWRRIRLCVVRIRELDCPVGGATKNLFVSGPAQAFDEVLMELSVPYLFSGRQIPHLHYAVAGSGAKPVERLGIFGYLVYSIDMTFAQLAYERRRKHACRKLAKEIIFWSHEVPFEFRGIKGASVFPSSFEWMVRAVCSSVMVCSMDCGEPYGSRLRGNLEKLAPGVWTAEDDLESAFIFCFCQQQIDHREIAGHTILQRNC
jgi:hypothetical protein